MTMTPGSLITADDIAPYPHRLRIERESAATYVLVTATAPYRWALVQHHVSGWTCIATGEHTPTFPALPEHTADMVAERYGDGFTHIPRADYGLISDTAEIIHIRRDTPARIGAYCGESITRDYDPDACRTRDGRARYMQHCIRCTTTYRAEHYGRCPVEAR